MEQGVLKMRTFKTKPEERIKQLESLLKRTSDELMDANTTLRMIEGEIADIKFTMSTGHIHPNDLFEDIVAINERANLNRF